MESHISIEFAQRSWTINFKSNTIHAIFKLSSNNIYIYHYESAHNIQIFIINSIIDLDKHWLCSLYALYLIKSTWYGKSNALSFTCWVTYGRPLNTERGTDSETERARGRERDIKIVKETETECEKIRSDQYVV